MKFFLILFLISCNPSKDFNSQIEGRWKCWKTEINYNSISPRGIPYSVDYFMEFRNGKFYDLILETDANYTIQDSIIYFNNKRGYKILGLHNDSLKVMTLDVFDPNMGSKYIYIHYFKKIE